MFTNTPLLAMGEFLSPQTIGVRSLLGRHYQSVLVLVSWRWVGIQTKCMNQ